MNGEVDLDMRTLTTGYEDSPLGLSPKKIGEDIAEETAKDWKSLRVTVYSKETEESDILHH